MTLAIALGSIAALAVVLWIFNRVAWGGGIRSADFAAYAGEPPAGQAAPPRPLPGADPERIEIRCDRCAFAKALPEASRLAAALGGQGAPPLAQPCPECGGPLRVALNRQITHHGAGGPLVFSALRAAGGLAVEIDGTIYRSLSEIADPALRRQVAEALNLSEGTDDYSRNK